MINKEFVATLDYLVAASLWASIAEAGDQAQYYLHSVNYYNLKHHNGKVGRRTPLNWKARDDLYECLHEWQSRFPQVVRSLKSTLTETVVTAFAGELVDFPAGWA